MADWSAIKTEYITTETSYRKLAKKYGVGESTIFAKASKEKWVEQKEQHQSTTVAKALSRISDKEAERAAKVHTVADKLLDKIDEIICVMGALEPKDLRALTAALKDLKEIQNCRTELDLREQEARIENLRRQAMKDDPANVPTLTVEGLPEEFRV